MNHSETGGIDKKAQTGKSILWSERTYGRVVAKCREEMQLNQQELASLIYVHKSTIQNIERGRRLPCDHVRVRLAEALKLPLLEYIPSSIDRLEVYLDKRFVWEKQGAEAFVTARDKLSREEIACMKHDYLKAVKEKDIKTKSRVDKGVHEKIIFFCPDEGMRRVADFYQKMSIEFFQFWVPHLGYSGLSHRPENIRNHEALFEVLIEGFAREIIQVLELHLKSSENDLTLLRQCLSIA